VRLHEWARPGHTFHGKGLWLFGDDRTPAAPLPPVLADPTDPPPTADADADAAADAQRLAADALRPGSALTLVGSPNFGVRSSTRDLELQWALLTRDAALGQRLRAERDGLLTRSDRVTLDTLGAPARVIGGSLTGPRGLWVHAAWRLLRSTF
jgi:phosphatidylserine/phosphatidylglycerophosphate/cardiolipin synthase-like enzyme